MFTMHPVCFAVAVMLTMLPILCLAQVPPGPKMLMMPPIFCFGAARGKDAHDSMMLPILGIASIPAASMKLMMLTVFNYFGAGCINHADDTSGFLLLCGLPRQ